MMIQRKRRGEHDPTARIVVDHHHGGEAHKALMRCDVGGGGVGGGAGGDGGGGAAKREAEGAEIGGDGSGPGGGDDGGLRLLEEPLDGLAVRPVAQLSGQLEHPGRALGRHADPPSPPVHLRVSVLRGGPLRWPDGLLGLRRG